MLHTPLTQMILQLNSLLDSGKYDDVAPAEVAAHLDDGTVFEYLRDRFGADADFSLFFEGGPYCRSFRRFYVERLRDMNSCFSSGRKWGVFHRGLCLLIAWTNEVVQEGADWRPRLPAVVEPEVRPLGMM